MASTTDCPHGYKSKASCVECMMDGPVGPIAPRKTEKLKASRWIAARRTNRNRRRTPAVGPT